jgi:hypothetical protein
MHPKTQELYETYWNYWAERGTSEIEWSELGEEEKEVWSDLAAELERRGWQGA